MPVNLQRLRRLLLGLVKRGLGHQRGKIVGHELERCFHFRLRLGIVLRFQVQRRQVAVVGDGVAAQLPPAAARGARASLFRPARPGDVPQRAEVRDHLRVGGGAFRRGRLPRQAEDVVACHPISIEILRRFRPERLVQDTPRHLLRSGQPRRGQKSRRQIQEGHRVDLPRLHAGARQHEDAVETVPHSRLPFDVGGIGGGTPGAVLEAVIREDYHQGVRVGLRQQLAHELVLVVVEGLHHPVELPVILVAHHGHLRRHHVREAMAGLVDPLEVDHHQVGLALREQVQGGGLIVSRRGEDAGQVVDRIGVGLPRLALVDLGTVLLELHGGDVREAVHLVERDVGIGYQPPFDRGEVVGRVGGAGEALGVGLVAEQGLGAGAPADDRPVQRYQEGDLLVRAQRQIPPVRRTVPR